MALMFDHAVKYKGKFYPPNTPIEETPETPQEPQKYVGAQTADEEARLNAENPPQDAPEAPSEEIIKEPAQPVKKATKGRKKGDAQ